jgi:hypothetical protein
MASFPKQKAPKGLSQQSSTSSSSDPRFAALSTDPRFRLPSKRNTTVKLDNRLDRILKDDEFTRKASVDRYGRKVDKSQGKKELQKLYRLASSDEDDDDNEEGADEDEDVVKELQRVQKKYDPAREGGFSASESEPESDEDDESEESVEEAELPDETEAQVEMGDVTSRIAIVNLDWDNIRAVDIMAVAKSFVPADGRILSASVYPSEFGRERMEREEIEGPPKEIFQSSKKDETSAKVKKPSKSVKRKIDSDDEPDTESEDERIKDQLLQENKGAEFDSASLRRYQLDRLRYFYAVVECSSEAAAKSLYDNMDGREFLSSANFFDMRFVPDETSFEDDKPRDKCVDLPSGYKPSEFVTDALSHSKVKLTWDADDKRRQEVQKKAFSRAEIDENDMLAYIGSASSEDEEDEEDEPIDEDDTNADLVSTTSRATTKQEKREALRAALGLDLEPVPKSKNKREERHVGDMQITFTPALTGKKGLVFENEPPPPEESTMDQYVRKERDRKAKRKERAKARRQGLDPDVTGPETSTTNGKGSDLEQESQDDEPEDDSNEDPWNDPFFDDPEESRKQSQKARKAEKEAKRAARDETSKVADAHAAELELMLDDDDGVRHFDMSRIVKAEKKAKKHNKKKRREAAEELKGDNFEMDVADPRFNALFDSHEYAIDPSNAKFRDSRGMRELLEAGRKKRKHEIEGVERHAGKKRERIVSGDAVSDLVQKVKKKAKR